MANQPIKYMKRKVLPDLSYTKVKYRLHSRFEVLLDIEPSNVMGSEEVITYGPGVELRNAGAGGVLLTVLPGFAWDGATLAPDRWAMAASLCHDALVAGIRKGLIPKTCRSEFDRVFYQLTKKEGCPRWLAWLELHILWAMGDYDIRHPHPVRKAAAKREGKA